MQRHIDKQNVTLSQQIGHIQEVPIQQYHEKSDNSNPMLLISDSSCQPTQRLPPDEAAVSPIGTALSLHKHSNKNRHTQPDTPLSRNMIKSSKQRVCYPKLV